MNNNKKLEELEKKVVELEKSNKKIKLTCYKKYSKVSKIILYDIYDEYKIKKDFNVITIFKCFTKGNSDLHCEYYIDGINNYRNLVISDSYEKLQKDVVEIGSCE